MNIFHRITLEGWQDVLSRVSLVLFICIFLAVVLYALGMSRNKLSHMENLPLEGDSHE